jgi:uncharacterized protein YgbK (DUF1537 family)
MYRLKTFIIADDLTGALDSIAPYAAVGMSCIVATSPAGLCTAIAQMPEVLSINLGTRELDSGKARAVANETVLAAQRHVRADTIWFKKIDSRMKGQVAAEVTGVVDALGAARILICPAIPDFGRIVIAGHVEGQGVARPIPVSLDLPGNFDVMVPEARTNADLDDLVGASPSRTLFVGARGLAAALARQQRPAQPPILVPIASGTIGYCIGSRDPITLAQIERLNMAVEPHDIAVTDDVIATRRGAGWIVVQAIQKPGASEEQVAARMADEMLKHVEDVRTLVLSGGETSAAFLRAAGVNVLSVVGEVLPGLPLCHAVNVSSFPALVTKSGGFGQPDTLLQLWKAAFSKEGQSCH